LRLETDREGEKKSFSIHPRIAWNGMAYFFLQSKKKHWQQHLPNKSCPTFGKLVGSNLITSVIECIAKRKKCKPYYGWGIEANPFEKMGAQCVISGI